MLGHKALRGGEGHGEGMLCHRLGVSAAIAGDGHPGRQVAQRDEVHPGRHELHESGAVEQRRLARAELRAGVPREQHGRGLQRPAAGSVIELVQVDGIGAAAELRRNGGPSLLVQVE